MERRSNRVFIAENRQVFSGVLVDDSDDLTKAWKPGPNFCAPILPAEKGTL
jgi:hypothetical protein